MTDVTISILAVNNVEIVAHLHALCFHEAWDAETIRKVLGMPGAFGFAARVDPAGDIDGFALARIVVDECELLSLGVAPNKRRRGIGGRLFDAVMVHAYALNAVRFYLEVAEDNADALRLYEVRGLVPVGRRPDYYRLNNGQRTAALTMRCDLPVR